MINTKAGRSSGFTMVELLIAVIIIGILVTIIVPVLSNRAADARIAAAKADMEAIANAESQVALDTGYVVRLHVLDDSGAIGEGTGSSDPLDVIDTIREEHLNTSAGNPDLIFLDAKTGVLLPNTLYTRVQADPEAFGWRGPYVNFQRKLTPTNPVTPFPANFEWSYGSPLDPWGNPYFLFVAGEELTGAPAIGGVVEEDTGQINPVFTYGSVSGADATIFDRMTVLSLGPDGVPGSLTGPNANLLGAGDDLVRSF